MQAKAVDTGKIGGWAAPWLGGFEPCGSGRRLSSALLLWDSLKSPVTEDLSREAKAFLYWVITHESIHNLKELHVTSHLWLLWPYLKQTLWKKPQPDAFHLVQVSSMENSLMPLAQQAWAMPLPIQPPPSCCLRVLGPQAWTGLDPSSKFSLWFTKLNAKEVNPFNPVHVATCLSKNPLPNFSLCPLAKRGSQSQNVLWGSL